MFNLQHHREPEHVPFIKPGFVRREQIGAVLTGVTHIM